MLKKRKHFLRRNSTFRISLKNRLARRTKGHYFVLDMIRRVFSWLGCTVLFLAGLLLTAWCTGIVYYMIPYGEVLVWLFLADSLFLVLIRKRIRLAMVVFWAVIGGLLGFYTLFPATNDKEWLAPWGRLPQVVWNGPDSVTVENVRDFIYTSPDDYKVRYRAETFRPADVRSLDFAVSHWDGLEMVAHTMLSFGFKDGRYLAISAETRLPKGVEQGSLPGLFKQFNLMYIPATEQDLFALRTNYRKEDLYLYRLNLKPEQVRVILLEFLKLLQEQNSSPEFYNTLTNNCTTSLLPPFRSTLNRSRFDSSPLLNGMSDRFAFDAGSLRHAPGETFEEFKRRSLVPHGNAADNLEDYSHEIRRETGID